LGPPELGSAVLAASGAVNEGKEPGKAAKLLIRLKNFDLRKVECFRGDRSSSPQPLRLSQLQVVQNMFCEWFGPHCLFELLLQGVPKANSIRKESF
jgi:hypothetical protein